MKTSFENRDFCKRCGHTNAVTATAYDEGFVSEAETVCNSCNYSGFWAYGFYEPDFTDETGLE